MKILIIGNGFDLAHKLPTSYKDFLNACDGKWKKEESKYGEDVAMWENYEEFVKEARKCFWISHFRDRRIKLGDKWLNFENEIEAVMMGVYSKMIDSQNEEVDISKLENEKLKAYLKNRQWDKKKHTYNELFEKLLKDHKILTSLLSKYMSNAFLTYGFQKKPQITNINANKILSFNYTDTFIEYNAEVDWCFIHGSAGKSNIVLGFDDHYLPDAKVIPELIPFEKYYQRIVNETESGYFKWLEALKQDEVRELHVYGHSLAPSDGDVLRKFILFEGMKTTIYYLNETDRAEKVKNLAIVLGPDELIKLTGGNEPQILFKKCN